MTLARHFLSQALDFEAAWLGNLDVGMGLDFTDILGNDPADDGENWATSLAQQLTMWRCTMFSLRPLERLYKTRSTD